jgi:beta-glucosidase
LVAASFTQVYLSHEGISGAPVRELKDFRRVRLAPGEKRSVSFTLHDRELSVVDETGQRRVAPGEVKVWIGGGQPISQPGLQKQPGVAATFTITNGTTLPD